MRNIDRRIVKLEKLMEAGGIESLSDEELISRLATSTNKLILGGLPFRQMPAAGHPDFDAVLDHNRSLSEELQQ